MVVHKSPYPALELPNRPLGDWLLERAATHVPTKVAYIDARTDRRLTFAEVISQSHAIGWALQHKYGVRKGSVVALVLPNLLEFPLALYGALLTGATVALVNPLSLPEHIVAQLKENHARVVFVAQNIDLQPPLAAAGLDSVHLISVPVTSDPLTVGTPFDSVLAEGSGKRVPPAAIEPHTDVALLLYSSGTTGLPKAVELSHSGFIAVVFTTAPARGTVESESKEVDLILVPVFHIYGLFKTCEVMHAGNTGVYQIRANLELMLRYFRNFKITRAPLVPPLVLLLAKSREVSRYPLQLKSIYSGAAPLSREVALQCEQRCKCPLRQAYGMTEIGIVLGSVGMPGEIDRESVGVLFPNHEARIVDPATGADQPAGKSGELWVRGPQTMRGYRGRLAETAQFLDSDGWCHTGDVALVNEKGWFYIVDRIKELIKYKAFQVAPAELEATLLKNPKIADAACIPLKDEAAGEIPKAFVVLKPAEKATAEEIAAAANAQLETYKHIRAVEFIDAIPKSASGKLLRKELVELERKRATAGQPSARL